MNVPNLLTTLRILLTPLFVYLLVYDFPGWALGVFLVAGLTDALDGAIARTTGQQTELGRYLDPLADKCLILSGLVTLWVLGWVPFWVLLMVVSRDVILIFGTVVMHLTEGHFNVDPSLLGKTTTVAQLALVVVTVLQVTGVELAVGALVMQWVVGSITLASGLHYLYLGSATLNRTTPGEVHVTEAMGSHREPSHDNRAESTPSHSRPMGPA